MDRNEKLATDSTYGDTAVRTMGELLDKAERATGGQLYGMTVAQIYGVLQPNKPADIDRALAHLQSHGKLHAAYLRSGGPVCYFPGGPRLAERIEAAQAVANGQAGGIRSPRRLVPAG